MLRSNKSNTCGCLTGGVAIEDLSKYLGRIEKKGYTAAIPAAPERKTRGRKKAE